MSSTNRGGVRESEDFYETQERDSVEMVERMRAFMPERPRIFEPMAGRGALVRVMRKVWPGAYIVANEINPSRAAELAASGADTVVTGDLFSPELGMRLNWNFDLALTNPAFKFALETAEFLIPRVPHVVLLQRLGWLASSERLPFWAKQRYDFGILAARPSFAASLSCGRTEGKGKAKVKRPCGWAVIQYLDAARPDTCPGCRAVGIESPVNCSTSDSADYCWYHFCKDSQNQHFHLGRVDAAEQGDLLKGVA